MTKGGDGGGVAEGKGDGEGGAGNSWNMRLLERRPRPLLIGLVCTWGSGEKGERGAVGEQ